MRKVRPIQKMTSAALLIAVGIIIPLFSPVKIVLEPAASFTLASHVAIFIGMFISPFIAVSVAAGTTLGFLMAGFPPVVILRAATHIVFSFIGAFWLSKNPSTLASPLKSTAFSFSIGMFHAVGEVIASTVFYFGGSLSSAVYSEGYFTSILLLVGVGTILHSMVDFGIAVLILKALGRQKTLAPLFAGTPYAPLPAAVAVSAAD